MDFRNTILILTSNVGSDFILNEEAPERRRRRPLPVREAQVAPSPSQGPPSPTAAAVAAVTTGPAATARTVAPVAPAEGASVDTARATRPTPPASPAWPTPAVVAEEVPTRAYPVPAAPADRASSSCATPSTEVLYSAASRKCCSGRLTRAAHAASLCGAPSSYQWNRVSSHTNPCVARWSAKALTVQ